MFSASYLNRWALSISTVAVTIVGTFSPITVSPVAAQTAPCISNPDINAGTFPIRQITPTNVLNPIPNPASPPATLSSATQNAARNAALAFYPNNNTPNPLFNRFDRDGTVLEFRGRQPNDCQIEFDVFQGSNKIQEIEQQIQTSAFNTVPASVRTRLNQALPNRTTLLIERSIRPNRVVGPTSSLSGDPVFYEFQVVCTSANPIPGSTAGNYCVRGQLGAVEISSNGDSFLFELNQD